MTEWAEYRSLFPVMENLIFLNHAAMAPLSSTLLGRATEYLEDIQKFGAQKWFFWQEHYERVRTKTAEFLNCSPLEIGFTCNTTDGMYFVIDGLDWKPGDNIVSIEKEFVANYYPWKTLSASGVEMKLARQKNGRFDINEIESLIDEKTRLLTLSWVQFLSGYKAPLKELSALCRKRGVLFAVDAIQGLGALKLDLSDVDIDFLFCGTHKWLLSLVGTGIFYCKKENIEKLMPKRIGWLSFQDPFNFSDLQQPLKEGLDRFEFATQNQLGVLALGESIKIIQEIGPENVEERLIYLTDYLVKRLREEEIKVFSPRGENEKSGIVSFSNNSDSEQLFSRIKNARMAVSLREGKIRVSPHFYNSTDNLEHLVHVISNQPGDSYET